MIEESPVYEEGRVVQFRLPSDDTIFTGTICGKAMEGLITLWNIKLTDESKWDMLTLLKYPYSVVSIPHVMIEEIS